MNQSEGSHKSGDENPTLWSQQQALELWKYFDGMGATDKNTMVAVEALLLGFSAATIAYVGATLLPFRPVSNSAPSEAIRVVFGMVVPVTELFKAIGVALVGIVIAWVAVYVALLYGGYSNRNWAKAAAIARQQAKGKSCSKWNELQHDCLEAVDQTKAVGKSSYFYGRATHYGRAHDPNTELPPIFLVYTRLAIGAAAIHLLIILLSIALILWGKA